MTLNRDQKGKIALGVLGVLALYMVYTNLIEGPPSAPSSPAARATAPAVPTIAPATDQSASRRAVARSTRTGDFHPVLHSKRPEDRLDPMTIDPTLQLDRLAKVMKVEAAGGNRNLFAFGAPPPKPTELTGLEPKVLMGPKVAPPAPPAPGPPVEAPPPPISLKFYGFSTVRHDGRKTAYFMDGDEILIAAEGETLKHRYKLVRIGPTSVLMEDEQSKRQQSLPLTQEAQS